MAWIQVWAGKKKMPITLRVRIKGTAREFVGREPGGMEIGKLGSLFVKERAGRLGVEITAGARGGSDTMVVKRRYRRNYHG